MSRENKFRAWCPNREEMFKVRTLMFNTNLERVIVTRNMLDHCGQDDKLALFEFELMDYIGVKANGKKVYEDDIVKVSFEGEETIHTVEYRSDIDYPAYDLVPSLDVDSNGISYALCEIGYDIEVIGNKYENPELL